MTIGTPLTQSGRWKRKKMDELKAITGTAYCTSCQALCPKENVKIYRTRGGINRPRCDACQARRVAHMKGEK